MIQALQTHANGDTLARSTTFRSLLPKDEHANFSGLMYQNLSPILQPLSSQLNNQQLQLLQQLAAGSKPTVICAYGDQDRIEVASNSRFPGLDFNSLALLQVVRGRWEEAELLISRERTIGQMTATIELDDLHVQLGGRTILDGLSGALNGRAIGLLGPNGAGKSTLINTLLGFHPPARGTARVLGMDIRNGCPQVASSGWIHAGERFVHLRDDWASFRPLYGRNLRPSSEQAMERAHEAFFYVGLGEVRYRKLGTYSLGMKQLAKLAQAIAHGPKMLIMDEPTNGLDPPARQRMIQLVREIRDASDMRLIISSHLLRDVEETCEEVLILRNGRVAALCNLEEERRANRKFLELETIGANGAFSSALQQLGCECAVFNNGRMKVVMPDKIEIREVYRIAEQQGIQIRKMNHRRDSLEDIFLNAMEQTGAAHGGL